MALPPIVAKETEVVEAIPGGSYPNWFNHTLVIRIGDDLTGTVMAKFHRYNHATGVHKPVTQRVERSVSGTLEDLMPQSEALQTAMAAVVVALNDLVAIDDARIEAE